jgi:hypothetical protein
MRMITIVVNAVGIGHRTTGVQTTPIVEAPTFVV